MEKFWKSAGNWFQEKSVTLQEMHRLLYCNSFLRGAAVVVAGIGAEKELKAGFSVFVLQWSCGM